MPHFCPCGADEYICQVCGNIRCSKDQPSEWLPVARMNGRSGNVCVYCVNGETYPATAERHLQKTTEI